MMPVFTKYNEANGYNVRRPHLRPLRATVIKWESAAWESSIKLDQ